MHSRCRLLPCTKRFCCATVELIGIWQKLQSSVLEISQHLSTLEYFATTHFLEIAGFRLNPGPNRKKHGEQMRFLRLGTLEFPRFFLRRIFQNLSGHVPLADGAPGPGPGGMKSVPFEKNEETQRKQTKFDAIGRIGIAIFLNHLFKNILVLDS